MTHSSTIYQRCYPPSLIRRSDSGDSLNKRSIHSSTSSRSSSSSLSSQGSEFFSYEDECAPQLRIFIISRLEKQIERMAQRVYGHDRIMFALDDKNPLLEAVDEILRLSEDEPYGVRGAQIIVKIKSPKSESETLLGSIPMDESTISTFKIVLVLNEETKMSLSIKNWFGSLLTGSNPVHLIGSKYYVKKLRLYRTCQNSESLEDNSYCP